MLSATGISKRFGETQALNQVSLELAQGSVHAILGENGSGKSTLMRILVGELTPDSGTITLNGQPYAPTSPQDAKANGVALVHQELAVCPHLTVTENLFLGSENHSKGILSEQQMQEEARSVFAKLGHPDLNVTQKVSNLSTAFRQLIDIARAVRSNAKVILFDEPTTSLARSDVEQLFKVIRTLREQGTAIAYITHFLDEVQEIADTATVLRDGEYVSSFQVQGTSTHKMAELMTGRELSSLYERTYHQPGKLLLQVREQAFESNNSLIEFDLHEGEVIGIAGLNGSGRTELLRRLFGLDPNREKTTPAKSWKSGKGIVSEDRKGEGLALKLSVCENLVLPKPGNKTINKSSQTQRTQTMIERLGIKTSSPHATISHLSGGNQQKVAFARLLDMDSKVLLLDEPTKGIDIGAKEQIYREINLLTAQGKGVILISSYLPELLGLSDRIVVLRRGEMVQNIAASQTNEQELLAWCAGA